MVDPPINVRAFSNIAVDDGAEKAEFVIECYEAPAVAIRLKSAELDWISSLGYRHGGNKYFNLRLAAFTRFSST